MKIERKSIALILCCVVCVASGPSESVCTPLCQSSPAHFLPPNSQGSGAGLPLMLVCLSAPAAVSAAGRRGRGHCQCRLQSLCRWAPVSGSISPDRAGGQDRPQCRFAPTVSVCARLQRRLARARGPEVGVGSSGRSYSCLSAGRRVAARAVTAGRGCSRQAALSASWAGDSQRASSDRTSQRHHVDTDKNVPSLTPDI